MKRQYEPDDPLILDIGDNSHEPFVLVTIQQIVLVLSQLKNRKELR